MAGGDHEDTSSRGRDRAADREVFRRYAGSVLRFFRSKLSGGGEDLTQEAFARYFRQAPGGDPRVALFRICRALVNDALRSNDPSYDESLTSVADLSRPASTALRERQHLLAALQSLPAGDQMAIELHYWEGLSSTELGSVFGTSASAARSRLQLARERLRTSLSKSFHRRPAHEFEDLEQWVQRLRSIVDEKH